MQPVRLDEADRLAALEQLVHDLAALVTAPDSGVVAGNESFITRITSRKFLLTLAGVLGALIAGLGGILPAEWSGGIIAVLIVVYQVVNAILGTATVKAQASVVRR